MKSAFIKIFIPFLICFLLFTPLGLFSDKIDPFEHSGFFSLTTIDAMDDQGYYGYLRSLALDGDIDFFNENNYAYQAYFTQTGYTLNLWPVGPAVLWAPFFLAAEGVEWTLRKLGLTTDSRGYGWSHLVATGLATCFYVFCGLLLLYRTLTRWFSPQACLVAVWTLFLSSPLIYFTFIRSRMGSFCEFFAVALFLFLWSHRPERKQTIWWALSLGGSLALMAMSRYTNAAVILLPLAIFIGLAWDNLKTRNWAGLKQLNGAGFWVLLASIAVFSVQFLVWFILFGKFFPDDPHLAKFTTIIFPDGLGALWDRFVFVLTGPYFGLAWCFQPWLIGFIGLFFLQPERLKFEPLPGQSAPWPKEFSWFKWISILLAFIPFYLTLTWAVGEFSSYGRRYLIASLPFIAIGLAALYDRFRRARPILLGFAGLSIFLNLAHMVQFRWLLHYFDPHYSLKAIKNIPNLLEDPAGFLSTSFFKVVTAKGFSIDSPTDLFFIAGVPLLMALLMGVGLMFFGPGKNGEAGFPVSRIGMFLPVALAAATISASIYLSVTYKTFSQEELSRRARFVSIMRNYPEFIFDNTSPGNEVELLEAVRLNPQSSRAFLQLGFYYFKTGDLKRAAWHYERSIKLDRTNHNAWWAMGMLLKQEGNKEYMDYFAGALRLQPHRKYRTEYLFEMANAHYFKKAYRRAIDTMVKVTQLAPSWAEPWQNIAVNYYYLNDFERAKEYALKAKALGADVSEILTTLESNRLAPGL